MAGAGINCVLFPSIWPSGKCVVKEDGQAERGISGHPGNRTDNG